MGSDVIMRGFNMCEWFRLMSVRAHYVFFTIGLQESESDEIKPHGVGMPHSDVMNRG